MTIIKDIIACACVFALPALLLFGAHGWGLL